MAVSEHVVVIGGGVVGMCSADELLRRGHRVTVVERDANPGDGCSYGNGGLVVPSHFEPLAAPGVISMGLRMMSDPSSPFGIGSVASFEVLGWMARFALAANRRHVQRASPVLRDMNLRSRQVFEEVYGELAREAGYERAGEYMVCRTAAALESEKRLAGRAEGLGLRTRVLSKADLAGEEPGIEIDAAGAVYFEDDAKLTPASFMSGIRKRLIRCGGAIVDHSEVTGFELDGRRIKAVRTVDGLVEGDSFVLAAGAWSGKISRQIGLNLPLLAGKGYGMTVKNPPQTPRLPALLIEGRLAVTPMIDGLRFVGTMELGPPGDTKISPKRIEGMRRSIEEFYPAFRGFDFGHVPLWSGLRPCSPDGLPYIGKTGRLDNVIVATGHGMMGMSLGPVTGQLVAELVNADAPSIPLELLSPDRYA